MKAQDLTGLNQSAVDALGQDVVIDSVTVQGIFNQPVEDARLPSDGRRPSPYIDVQDSDIAALNTGNGETITYNSVNYIIISSEPKNPGMTRLTLRKTT